MPSLAAIPESSAAKAASKSKSKSRSKSKSPPTAPSTSSAKPPTASSSKMRKLLITKRGSQAASAGAGGLIGRINELVNENTAAARNRVEPLEWVLPNKKEFPLWVTQTFLKYRQEEKGVIPKPGKPSPLKHQQFLRDYMGKNSPYRGVLLYHGLGSGKCHAKGTPIIMADGSVKKVEEIVVGDELMGDDSTPRKVLTLARGTDKMFRISAASLDEDDLDYNLNFVDSFTVNAEHILCLKRDDSDEIHHLSVKDYLIKLVSGGNDDGDLEDYYLYRAPIHFPGRAVEGDSYAIGQQATKELSPIPADYKCNSREVRLECLAGILDYLDGLIHLDINQKILSIKYGDSLHHQKWMEEELIFLVRSLGLLIVRTPDGIQIHGGNLGTIPSRKYNRYIKEMDEQLHWLTEGQQEVSGSRQNNMMDLRYSFDIEALPEAEYFGFTLDGNSRYLLGDFTVTHNTLSSIFIAENLKSDRNIVFLSPASLKPNFIQDGLLKLGNPEYNTDPMAIYQKYSFVSFNASNTPDQIRAIGGFDNKVIIIEETHNLVSKMVSGILGSSKHGKEIYDYLMNAKNAKIIALTGSPAINDPFELAILFNVLRGYIEITHFAISKVGPEYGSTWDFSSVMSQLMDTPFIDYIEVHKANKSIEVHYTIKSYDPRYREATAQFVQKCSMLNIDIRYLNVENIPLFPTENDGQDFYDAFVHESSDGVKLINADVFKRRILGLVSYYTAKEDIPEKIMRQYNRVKMSDYQHKIYEVLRAKERKTEKGGQGATGPGGRKSKKRTMGTKSTFRVFSRQASNFVFPDEVPRPYPDPTFTVRASNYNKSNKNREKDRDNVKQLTQMIESENAANEEGTMAADYKRRIDAALAALDERGEVYFRAGPEGLNKLSPKMLAILENIQKSPGLVFVYSNFRSVEGIEIFKRVLNNNGFAPYGSNSSLPKYAVYSGTEDQEVKANLLRVFKDDNNKHGEVIKIMMATSAGAEGLDLKNIRQIHIMEPYWNQVRIKQVIGRGVRYRSHIALPPEERNVEVFRYFSVLSPTQLVTTGDRAKVSTDEYIEEVSEIKQGIINELEQCLKEAAVDCMLNAPYLRDTYKCFTFGSDAKGFAYMPRLKQDLISSYSMKSEVKEVKKEYKVIYFYDNKVYVKMSGDNFYLYRDATKAPVKIDDKTKLRVFGVDPATDMVYDYKSLSTDLKKLMGKINEKSQIVKVKGA
jgi:Hom_end-associated Hint/Helicase conserved C-terminal domain